MHRHTTKVERRDYPCWAVVEPAPDIKGKWVAHCLEFDTLAQADDPETAIELLLQSTNDIVLEDLRAGMNPLDRRAPEDDEGWSLLRFVSEKPDSMHSGTGTYRGLLNEAKDKAQHNHVVITIHFFLGFQRSVSSSHLDSLLVQQMSFQTRERDSVAYI